MAHTTSNRIAHHGLACIVVMLALGACPSDDGVAGDGTTQTPSSSSSSGGTTGTTTGLDSSSSMPFGTSESSVGEVDPCVDAQVIPPSPVDCAGADEVWMGTVTLEEGDDPSFLEGVVRIEGGIHINRTSLTNLDFMACVQEVTGDITIFGNDALVDVQGLWSLTEIGTDFVFSQNDAIEVFDGLPHVEVLVNNLVINENANLRRIDGFHRLVSIEGSAAGVGGNLTIQQNPVLESIDGLIGLLVIRGTLAITNNPMLCLANAVAVFQCIVEPAEPPPSWCNITDCWSC